MAFIYAVLFLFTIQIILYCICFKSKCLIRTTKITKLFSSEVLMAIVTMLQRHFIKT